MRRLGLLAGLCALLVGTASAQTPKHNCDFCHDHHGGSYSQLRSMEITEDLCLSCHALAGPATWNRDGVDVPIPKDVDIHDGAKHSAATSCWDCHDHEAEAGSNLWMIPTTLTTPNSGDKSVVFTATSGTNSYADGDATYDGVCEVCHTLTTQHTNDGSAGQHNAGDDCTSCHGHSGGFAGSGGSCRDCHASPQSGRRAITGEFSRPSHHVAWVDSVKAADCETCHDQSQHQLGSVRLWNVDDPGNTAASIVLAGDPLTSSTEAAKLTAFCLACHDADGANGSLPFSDGVTPTVIDATAWSSGSHSGAAAIVGCYGDGAFGCHASGHGSEKKTLLSPPAVAPTAPALAEEEEGFCFNCHDSDGPAGTDIESLFAGSIKWVTDIVGDYDNDLLNDRHDVQYAAQVTSGAVIECVDCHDPHTASASQKVIPDPDATDGRTPGDGFITQTGGDYLSEWCLDCHDGSYSGGITPPDTMLADIYASVIGSKSNAMGDGGGKATLRSGYGWAADMFVPCMSCHDPHASSNLFHVVETVMSFDGTTPVPADGTPATLVDNNIQDFTLNGYYWCNTCHTGSMGSGKANCFSCHFHGTRW